MPCDNAILSVHELGMRNFQLQPTLRIMTDEITGRDRRAWRASDGPRPDDLVDRDAAGHPRIAPAGAAAERDDLQVAAGVLGALVYLVKQPIEGHSRARRAAA